jgi:Flp pilus assembly protein TadB
MTKDEEKATQETSFILNYISADVLATFLRDVTGRFVVCLATFWDVVGTFSNVG